MRTNPVVVAEQASIRPADIRIGKDIIEILTSGMYVSPLSVYREYVQNAADAIEEARRSHPRRAIGRVAISIDHTARSVSIIDDGTGIPSDQAVDVLLAVGGSRKRGTDARGFRGVGRLSGLAYCRQIDFVTKADGDARVATLTWDCRKLREVLASRSANDDLRSVIAEVVSVSFAPADAGQPGFFEVRLREISRLRNDLLLNEQLIADYLAQVAPVAFAPEFSFGRSIMDELRKRGTPEPIELVLGDRPIHRPHRDELPAPNGGEPTRIREVEFFDIADVDGDKAALAWIGHHDYVRSLPVGIGIRGLRARVGNIQVGEANLFEDSYKETRFNSWTIGEIHVFDRRVVPNARRDNFEASHHYSNLLVQIGPIAAMVSQRCRESSLSRTALQTVENLIQQVQETLKRKTKPERAELSRMKASIQRAEGKAQKIDSKPDRQRALDRLAKIRKKLSALTPRRGPATVAISEVAGLISKLVTNRAQAEKLLSEIRRLSE
ncbi:ATP-binding protein [Bradyrhizobium tunisiense]|uniref:ATP-binding protein n=1 Tax=Bradyrhizobium tunisiense TaxID=3278709 RepID=UPI0035E32D3C